MNKSKLIEKISKDADISQSSAARSLSSAITRIIKTVSNGDEVTLFGFGTFESRKRAARIGRNPSSGEEIKIPASRTIKFTAGKAFKDTVNKRK